MSLTCPECERNGSRAGCNTCRRAWTAGELEAIAQAHREERGYVVPLCACGHPPGDHNGSGGLNARRGFCFRDGCGCRTYDEQPTPALEEGQRP